MGNKESVEEPAPVFGETQNADGNNTAVEILKTVGIVGLSVFAPGLMAPYLAYRIATNMQILQNANRTNLIGVSTIHLASNTSNYQVAGDLSRNNADAEICSVCGKRHHHFTPEWRYAQLHKARIDLNGEVNAADTALRMAAPSGHTDVANSSLNLRALQSAVEQRYAAIAKNLNTSNNATMTPLHLACQHCYISIVKILLDNRAAPNVMKQSDETPFYLAAKNGHADIVELLLRRGLCDFVLTEGKETPLHVAVKGGHIDVVKAILKYGRRIYEELTTDGEEYQENTRRRVMPIALPISGDRLVFAEIVYTDRNMPLELKRDSKGNSPLALATSLIDLKMVELLLGIDKCMQSETNIAHCFRSIIKRILSEEFAHEDLSDAIKCRLNLSRLAQLLINTSKFNANHQGDGLNTFLHEVMAQNNEINSALTTESSRLHLQVQTVDDVIKLLLENGADFNMRNILGKTPLIIASENGRCHAIQAMFDWERKSGMKLDIDVRDRYGATAMIKAAEKYHVSVVRLLLSHEASVNLCNYCGFSSLHAAFYEPNTNLFDLYFFCELLLKLNFDDNRLQTIIRANLNLGNGTWKPDTVIDLLQNWRSQVQVTTNCEQVVELLLDNDETDANIVDFRGNTSLDLAVKCSKRIASRSIAALKHRSAIQKLLEPQEEAQIEVKRVLERRIYQYHRQIQSNLLELTVRLLELELLVDKSLQRQDINKYITNVKVQRILSALGSKVNEMARIDERRRNPLHRLIISRISLSAVKPQRDQDHKDNLDLMVDVILLKPGNFLEFATARDDKGRTPLHYAVMQKCMSKEDGDLVRVLLKMVNLNEDQTDVYGKTPLHYAEMIDHYDLLIQYGADENTKDKYGYTPKDLKELRKSVKVNQDNARNLQIGKKSVKVPSNIAQVLNPYRVTNLTRQRLVETVRINSQSPGSNKASEEAIWKIWTTNEFTRLNRRISQLKPPMQHFIERLTDGIKKKDERFECQPILVGSANEETKVILSADFDYSVKLIKFSQLCEAFPHPLGPIGYFQLKRKTNGDAKRSKDKTFDCFFNMDQCLLTNEVNARFHMLVGDVIKDPTFWQNEHLFELDLIDDRRFERPAGLCKTLHLRMIHPIEDGEGDFIFVNFSIDIVACVDVEGWLTEDPLPVGISPYVKENGSTVVFDQPRVDPYRPDDNRFLFSETFSRITFAQIESRIIKECSPLKKAAYIVCKMMLHRRWGTTYQFKTGLLFFMEAFTIVNGSKSSNEDMITPKQLAFWVERLMFCINEFSRRRVYPCYFMSSFKQQSKDNSFPENLTKINEKKELEMSLEIPVVCGIYLDLCPHNTAIDIPILRKDIAEEGLNEIHDPNWKNFDRKEFLRKLSSRNSI